MEEKLNTTFWSQKVKGCGLQNFPLDSSGHLSTKMTYFGVSPFYKVVDPCPRNLWSKLQIQIRSLWWDTAEMVDHCQICSILLPEISQLLSSVLNSNFVLFNFWNKLWPLIKVVYNCVSFPKTLISVHLDPYSSRYSI